MEGLRVLARIIARHYWSTPNCTPSRVTPRAAGKRPAGRWRNEAPQACPPGPPGTKQGVGPDECAQPEPERAGPARRSYSGYVSQMLNGERCSAPEIRRRLMEAFRRPASMTCSSWG